MLGVYFTASRPITSAVPWLGPLMTPPKFCCSLSGSLASGLAVIGVFLGVDQ